MASPGSATFLIGHAFELVRLDELPGSTSRALQNYHTKVVSHRLQLGASLDPVVWTRIDDTALSEWFFPFTNESLDVPSSSTTVSGISSSSSAVRLAASDKALWSLSLPGSKTSTHKCIPWNLRTVCTSVPCRFRHACAFCGDPGHVQDMCGARRA